MGKGIRGLEQRRVTPRAGVWIEIVQRVRIGYHQRVTPRAGVWIEIHKKANKSD